MPAPKTDTGFVSLQDYLNANQPATQSTANSLADSASQQAGQAVGNANSVAQNVYNQAIGNPAIDPTSLPGYGRAQSDLDNASQAARGLGSFGGLSSTIGDRNPSETIGDRAFDANLLGGNSALSGVAAKYGNLSNYLSDRTQQALKDAANAPKPGAPAPAAGPAPIPVPKVGLGDSKDPRVPRPPGIDSRPGGSL